MKLQRVWAAVVVFGSGFVIALAINTGGMRGQPQGLRTSGLDSTMAVVLLVSPSCHACTNPALPDAWEAIAQSISDQGNGAYRIGLVTSDLAENGLTFLRQFGEFHEVLAGGGWAGVGSLHFLFRELSGPPTIPQVIVLRRQVTRQTKGISVDERVVQRRVGLEQIFTLAEELREASFTPHGDNR